MQQNQKSSQKKIHYPETEEGSSTTENARGLSRLGWVCFGVQVGFKLLSERGQGGRATNLTWKSIPNNWGKKLFDRFMTLTLTVPGTIRTAVGRKMWSKIPWKTCVKKLINRCVLKHRALFNRKPMQFLNNRSYAGVSTGA